MGRRRAHRIAVVVPVTGSRALWGQLLQNAIARASSSSPPDAPAARWIVHDEAALTGPIPIGGPDSTGLTDDSYSAVFGHLDPGLLDSTLPHYAAADLPCFLPFTHPEHRPRPDLVLGWSSSPRAQAELLVKLLRSVGARTVLLLRDSSTYGSRLAQLLNEALPELSEIRDAGGAQERVVSDAVVLCALYHRAAESAEALRDAGYRGHLILPWDCSIGEVFSPPGLSHGSHLVRPVGGAKAWAELAALALHKAALTLRAGATGTEWVAAVRKASSVPLDPQGRPVAETWQLLKLDGSAR